MRDQSIDTFELSRRVNAGRAAVGALALLVTVACGSSSVSRTAVIHGVTVTTDIEPTLAIAADDVDHDGARTLVAYAVLGDSGGRQIVGDTLKAGHKLHLRLAADADVWLQESGAQPRLAQPHGLRGLTGANAAGLVELRGGTAATRSMLRPATRSRSGSATAS